MSDFQLPAHSYDSMLPHHSPVALRLNDSTHQQIRPGDMLHFQGHGSILDRQRFKVLGRNDHPNIGHAVNAIHSSSLSARDKIKLTAAFTGMHGQQSSSHPVVSLNLEHHGPSPLANTSIRNLG